MAITVNSEPAAVHMARNPIAYELETDNRITTPGSAAAIPIEIVGTGINANDQFDLEWQNESETFVAKASPDDSGNQFPSTGSTTAEIADDLAEYLPYNYRIARDFDVTRSSSGGEYVILTLKENGNIPIILTEALTWLTTYYSPGVDEVTNENFKLFTRLFIQEDDFPGADLVLAVETELPVNTDEQAVFFYQNYIKAYLGNDVPDLTDINGDLCRKMMKQYYIQHAEKYGDPASVKSLTTETTKYAVNGGLSHQFYSNNSDLITDYISVQKNFFTWAPDNKEIYSGQYDFLYFMIYDSTTTLFVYADIYYTDGTSDLSQSITGIVSGQQYYMYWVPVGHNKIAALADANKTIDYWEIRVDKAGADYITKRRYYYNNKPQIDQEQVIFKNSWGAYESIRMFGNKIEGIEVSKDTFENHLDYNYTISDAARKDYNILAQKPITLNTGWMNKDWAKHMQELLLSEDRYIVINDELVPVVLNTDDLQFYVTRQNIYGIEIEFVKAKAEHSYSVL